MPSLTETWRIFVYLMEGLQVLHSQRIYHFDVKAQNIVISLVDNQPRLIDFGMAFRYQPNNPELFLQKRFQICKYHPVFILARHIDSNISNAYAWQEPFYKYFKYNPPDKHAFKILKQTEKQYESELLAIENGTSIFNNQKDLPFYPELWYRNHYLNDPKNQVANLLHRDPLLYYYDQYYSSPTHYEETIMQPNLGKIDIFQLLLTFFDLRLPYQKAINKQELVIRDTFKELYYKNMNPNVDRCWNLSENMNYINRTTSKLEKLRVQGASFLPLVDSRASK
jgi:serine/threonine protein kinase